MSLIRGVDIPAVVVGDMERALGFYRDLIGMEVVEVKGAGSEWSDEEQARWHAYHEECVGIPGARIQAVFLRAPDGSGLELISYLEPRREPQRRELSDAGTAVIPFAVTDSAAVVETLRAAGVEVAGGPVPYVLGGIRSNTTYIRDPDGNAICLFEVVEDAT